MHRWHRCGAPTGNRSRALKPASILEIRGVGKSLETRSWKPGGPPLFHAPELRVGGFDLGVVQGAFGVVLELGGHDIGRGRILHRLDTVAAVDTFKRRYGA